jgi:hypothetical protein
MFVYLNKFYYTLEELYLITGKKELHIPREKLLSSIEYCKNYQTWHLRMLLDNRDCHFPPDIEKQESLLPDHYEDPISLSNKILRWLEVTLSKFNCKVYLYSIYDKKIVERTDFLEILPSFQSFISGFGDFNNIRLLFEPQEIDDILKKNREQSKPLTLVPMPTYNILGTQVGEFHLRFLNFEKENPEIDFRNLSRIKFTRAVLPLHKDFSQKVIHSFWDFIRDDSQEKRGRKKKGR